MPLIEEHQVKSPRPATGVGRGLLHQQCRLRLATDGIALHVFGLELPSHHTSVGVGVMVSGYRYSLRDSQLQLGGTGG